MKITFVGFLFLLLSVNVNAQERVNVNLSLADVTRLAIENNFDIQLAQYDAWIARTKEGVAESIYDTILQAEASWQKDKLKRTSTIFGSTTQDNDYSIGLSKRLPTGTQIEIDQTNNRNASDSSFSTNSVTHDSRISASVTQPLLKNFFGMQDRGGVKLSLLDIEGAQFTSLDQISSELLEVQKAYWDLVSTYKLISITSEQVQKAKELYDLNQEKLEDGLVEIPEAIASEANYREKQNNLLLAQNNYESQANVLRILLNLDSDIAIVPMDPLEAYSGSLSVDESLSSAFENRVDYKVYLNNVKKRKLNVTLEKNNLWPELDLKASVTRNGLGEHFNDSINNSIEESNEDLFAGVTLRFPLENTKARANLKKARYEDAKALLNLKYMERKIAVNVQDHVRNTNMLNEIALNSIIVASLQEQKLEQELKRYSKGRSDTDTLIRFQNDLLSSQSDSIRAIANYKKALLELRKSEGALLKQYWNKEL